MTIVSFETLLKQWDDGAGSHLDGEGKTNEKQYSEFVVRCPFEECNCRIIAYKYSKGLLERHSVDIKEAPECIYIDPKTLCVAKTDKSLSKSPYFRVGDAWTFDNIGVSRPSEMRQPKIDGKDEEQIAIQRYLVCADCERGPIGFAGHVGGGGAETEEERIENASKLVYFLSAQSVRYERK